MFCVEYVIFYLDVEQFSHFDGTQADFALYAQSIVRKYLTDDGEFALRLPGGVREAALDAVREGNVQDVFKAAQECASYHMYNTILPEFFKSNEGAEYLKSLVARKASEREGGRVGGRLITATILVLSPHFMHFIRVKIRYTSIMSALYLI